VPINAEFEVEGAKSRVELVRKREVVAAVRDENVKFAFVSHGLVSAGEA
jgi:hypothetical protein